MAEGSSDDDGGRRKQWRMAGGGERRSSGGRIRTSEDGLGLAKEDYPVQLGSGVDCGARILHSWFAAIVSACISLDLEVRVAFGAGSALGIAWHCVAGTDWEVGLYAASTGRRRWELGFCLEEPRWCVFGVASL
ncbi:unnamed protein product [Calypogeia fissa]